MESDRGDGPRRPRIQTATGLRSALRTFARQIRDALQRRRAKAIAIGAFTGPARLDSNAGPGLQKALAEELQQLRVAVKKDADYSVKGEYAFVAKSLGAGEPMRPRSTGGWALVRIEDAPGRGRAAGGPALRLRATVRDDQEKAITELEADVRAEDDLIKTLGLTGSLPSPRNPRRNQQLVQMVRKPGVSVDGTQVKARAGSPYSVEVRTRARVADAFAARKPWVEKGLAFVTIRRGELYEVRVRNNSRQDTAVTLTIDGLDAFTFSELRDEGMGLPMHKYYFVRAGQTLRIPGWHKDAAEVHSFEITAFARSALAKLMVTDTSKMGTITVCVHGAYPVAPPKPRAKGKDGDAMDGNDDADGDGNSKKKEDEATGLGPIIKSEYIPLKRRIGVLREAVTVRYSKRAPAPESKGDGDSDSEP
jgi:hypothetical protein